MPSVHDVRVFNVSPNTMRPFTVEVDGYELRERAPRIEYSFLHGERIPNQQLSRIMRFRTEAAALRAADRYIASQQQQAQG